MRVRNIYAIVVASFGVVAANAGAQTIDGQLGTGSFAYGEYPFRLATQTTATGFGNNQSQIDAAYVNVLSDGSLAYMMTGNLESNGNGLVTMIDNGHVGAIASTDANGYGTFRDVGGRYTYHFGTRGGNSPGSIMSPGFNPGIALETNLYGSSYYQDVETLAPDGFETYVGSNSWRDKIANTGNTPPATPVVQNYAPNNTNAGNDSNVTSAYDDNNTITFTAGSPALAAYGFEANFSNAFLRQKPGAQLKLLLYIAGSGGSDYLSNQFLPGLPPGTANLGSVDDATPRFNVLTQTDHPQDFYLTVPTPTTAGAGATNWGDNSTWNTGFAPNGINTQGAIDASGGARTVTLGSAVTVGTLYVTGAGPTTVAGADLTLQTYFGDITVVRTSGNATIASNVKLAGGTSLEVSAGTKLTVSNLSATGDNFRNPSVAVSGGGTVAVAGNVQVGEITVSAGLMTFEPGNGGVLAGTSAATIGAEVAGWYAGGLRNGSGIGVDSSNALVTVGVIPNDDGQGGTLYSTFLTIPTVSGDVLLKATYIGDTDLNGTVDGNDLANLLAGMNGGLSGWQNGDTNYDGVVDATDLGNLLGALGGQGAPLGGSGNGTGGAVPEPSAIGLLVAPGALALRRRARR